MFSKNKTINYINSWKEKGIIDEHQKKLMIKDVDGETTTSNLFKIIAMIGALFIGAGTLLLISSNWEYLPKLVKLILILSMPIIGISGGYYLSYVKKDYRKIGDSFIFLGTLLIGASLALLGQLYNLDGSIAGLLTWWCVLTIPLTFLFRFRILGVLTISLFYLSLLYYLMDTKFVWDNASNVLGFFTGLSTSIILISYLIRTKISDRFSEIQKMFEIVSIKVLFLTLFMGTLDEELYFFGESIGSAIFQNILFLGIVFFVMWFSNKKYDVLLRNSTFFWIGAFMITKYFTWLWNYMQVGLFFVLFGVFLILLVFGYIRGTKYLESIKK